MFSSVTFVEINSPQQQASILHALREAERVAMLHDQRGPEPSSILLDMLVNPSPGSGGKWAEEKNGTAVVNENVWNFW
jgi:hypothetical protein